MRIFATSDLHGYLPEIPDCDVLIVAGDVCPDFHTMSFARYGTDRNKPVLEKGEQQQRHWLDTEFRAWLEALQARGIVVVGIAGNHDFVFEHPFLIPEGLAWHYLKDAGITVCVGDEDLRVYGTPWVPKLKRWAFYGSQEFLQARAEAIPSGIDILISHGPPFGLRDRVVPRFGDCHVGDTALTNELDRIRPRVVVCGHIHEGYGVDYFETSDRSKITVVNAAHVTEDYEPINPPVELFELSYA